MAQDIMRGILLSEYTSFDDLLTSVNTYADVGVWTTKFLKTKHFVFTAATNDLLVQIMGSVDGGTTYELTAESEFAVNSGATVTKTNTSYYTHVKVQVKPAVADTHGTLSTKIAGASF